jgi:uncharacterized membrane protein
MWNLVERFGSQVVEAALWSNSLVRDWPGVFVIAALIGLALVYLEARKFRKHLIELEMVAEEILKRGRS